MEIKIKNIFIGLLICIAVIIGVLAFLKHERIENLAIKYCNEKGFMKGEATRVPFDDKRAVYCETLNNKGEVVDNSFGYVDLDVYARGLQ